MADLKNKVIRNRVSIRDQCSKHFIYSLNPDDFGLEQALDRLECSAAAIIRQLLSEGAPPAPITRNWYHLLEFIVVQHSRTPSAGRALEAFVSNFAREIAKTPGVLKMDPPPTLDQLKNIHVRHPKPELLALSHSVEMIPCLFDLQDLVVVNESALEFVLPDVGIVLHNEWGRKVRGIGMTGYSSSGLQMFLPLSPTRLLVKFDPGIYRVPGGRMVASTCQSDVAKINRLLIAHAEQNIYFSGSSVTAQFLGRFERHRRTPRAEYVRSVSFRSADNERQTILGYEELPDIALDVRWMRIQKHADSIPIYKRARMLREASARRGKTIGKKQKSTGT